MGKVESDGIKLMDYLFTDGSIGKTIGNKIPVAIAVAPASHFADGKWRFMSLKYISTESTYGTLSNEKMSWGKYNQTVSGLTSYGNISVTINSDGTFKELSSAQIKDLPVGTVKGTYACNNLWNGWYYSYVPPGYPAIPPPFLNDGKTKNTLYFMDGQNLHDIDGESNTSILCTYTDSTYKAAPNARAFNPGFGSGDWYLPAAGELGYVQCQLYQINTAIQEAVSQVSDCGVEVSRDKLWSSTQSGASAAILITMGNGVIRGDYKHANNGAVRAFIKI